MDVILLPGERADDLQREGLRVIQREDGFRFGMDSVLLAHFARLRPRDAVADMGAGSGVLPILMSAYQPTATFMAFEWQEDAADRARRSVLLNGLESRIAVYAEDYRRAALLIGYESVDATVCNPPYGKRGGALVSESAACALARHETDCPLPEIVAACASILRYQGRAFFVYPAPRLLELCDALREHRLEPKRVRMVCAKAGRAPYLTLMEAVKGARPGLHWLPPLTAHHADGSETDELKAIYAGASANPAE